MLSGDIFSIVACYEYNFMGTVSEDALKGQLNVILTLMWGCIKTKQNKK